MGSNKFQGPRPYVSDRTKGINLTAPPPPFTIHPPTPPPPPPPFILHHHHHHHSRYVHGPHTGMIGAVLPLAEGEYRFFHALSKALNKARDCSSVVACVCMCVCIYMCVYVCVYCLPSHPHIHPALPPSCTIHYLQQLVKGHLPSLPQQTTPYKIYNNIYLYLQQVVKGAGGLEHADWRRFVTDKQVCMDDAEACTVVVYSMCVYSMWLGNVCMRAHTQMVHTLCTHDQFEKSVCVLVCVCGGGGSSRSWFTLKKKNKHTGTSPRP
jgi:hypothetical protein